MKLLIACFLCFLVVAKTFPKEELPLVDLRYKTARVQTNNNLLTVSTGKIERVYKITSSGLATISLKNKENEKEWSDSGERSLCDWSIGNNTSGNLIALKAYISDDEEFTDKHICTEAEFEYPEKKLRIKYIIWVYPGAQGIRTQLQLKKLSGFDPEDFSFNPGITEMLHLENSPEEIRAFGYFQGIKTNMNIAILKESDLSAGKQVVDWANGLILSHTCEGVILVKESNKSTSLRLFDDLATGSFLVNASELSVSGVGMFPENLSEDEYLKSWANWVILYSGENEDAKLALKEFDRRRYPVHPERDIFIMANTWGTEDKRPECLYAAREENVLRELESIADLGIDLLQIDDGWQTSEWLPAKNSQEHQHQDLIGDYDIYPTGWENVTVKANQLNVKLGLWAAWTIPMDKLKWNYDQGYFSAFKLDFANLNTIKKRDDLMNKARTLIKYSGYNTCVNWDVTEKPPRAGFFYGREYGNIYLENRKVNTERPGVQYIPFKVLKDAWHLSKYVNLNKFQVTIQNIDLVKDSIKTDAYKYNHPYVVGIALMSSPIFFQETHYYSDNAREQIKPILSVYKEHRTDMYAGYVFPIGDEPDNKSWTGFQNYNPKSNTGYLTIFRELHNSEPTKRMALKFLKNNKIRLINLLTNEAQTLRMQDNRISLSISHPAGFKFYKYEIIE